MQIQTKKYSVVARPIINRRLLPGVDATELYNGSLSPSLSPYLSSRVLLRRDLSHSLGLVARRAPVS